MAALKNHPGMWLRDDAAAAINALEDKYGVIRINSAGRTVAEQNELIRRWKIGGKANRPPALFEPKQPPEASTHVANGGIAVDVYNYTTDRAKLREFGFEWFGDSDKVHYTFRGWNPPQPPAAGGSSNDSLAGLRWFGIQRMLKSDFGYTGGIDNIPGEGSIKAFQRFMNAKGYAQRAPGVGRALVVDGLDGNLTLRAAQQWLKETGRYSGDVDGKRGPGTDGGWQRAETENWNAYSRVR